MEHFGAELESFVDKLERWELVDKLEFWVLFERSELLESTDTLGLVD